MTEDERGRHRRRRRLWLALAVLATILAVLIVPPLVSVSRYKSRITQLIASSLGRPVHLGSVELRILPMPGFVLTDLTVEEDPAYGAEPVLHANSVTASIRLLSLWRGRLEISRISVDEASLNLVRTDAGRWNLDPLFRTAAANAGAAASGGEGPPRPVPLPYLEATNSRINFKNGAEKLPYSLVDTDLSFWQEQPGDWRIRLRSQPARTDVSLDLADTGVVRLEANIHRAAELRQMPVHLDLEWREAQLGQLSRLVIGSDPGWRGDLTGELHLDGTPEAAQIKTRLRATGVHRAEFAPAAPMDFDANCGFVYHFSGRAVENLVCDSPFGAGRIRLAGDLPGEGGKPHFSVELDRIPVAAGLDALRTVRSGFGAGLEAAGAISGKISYGEGTQESSAQDKTPGAARGSRGQEARTAGKTHAAATHTTAQGPLTGSFTVEGFQLSGDGIHDPIQIPRLILAPVVDTPKDKETGRLEPRAQIQAESPALAATVAVPAGGAGPLTVTARLGLSGYQLTVRGQAALTRARELARVAGMAVAPELDALAGDAVNVDLSAGGPWMAVEKIPFSSITPALNAAEPAIPAVDQDAAADYLSGTVTLHNANWKADYLANHVEISTATLHLDNRGGKAELRWDPVIFSYGPIKGTASLDLPAGCIAPQLCLPSFQVQFGALDASTLQAAILGAHEPGTLLSELLARLNPSTAPAWPELEGTVKADSLIVGPAMLGRPSATLRILKTGAEITGLDAGLLGGRVHGSGTLQTGEAGHANPAYILEGTFEKLSPPAVGALLGLRWSGGVLDADGKVELSGFTGEDLAASAKGTLHFEWRHGGVGGGATQGEVPAALARFDRWTADAEIANGTISLKQNQMVQGSRKRAVEAGVTFGDPPRVNFGAARETQAKR